MFLANLTEADEGISSGGVAGIVIGVLVALVALSALLFLLYKRYIHVDERAKIWPSLTNSSIYKGEDSFKASALTDVIILLIREFPNVH